MAMMVDPPLVNFAAILGEHGAAMHIGMSPPASNIVDSPMQAWTDSNSSPESEAEEVVVQSMFSSGAEFYVANALVVQSCQDRGLFKNKLTADQVDSLHFAQALKLGLIPFESEMIFQISILGKFAKDILVPSPLVRALKPPSSLTLVSIFAGKRSLETFTLLSQPPKKFPRLVELMDDNFLTAQEPALSQGLTRALSTVDNALVCSNGPMSTPLTTGCVRRSPRANKYDGFKNAAVRDVKVKKSKVKPIVKPSVLSASADDPPPMPITTLQCIGVKLCGVPPEEVSSVKLLASPLNLLQSIFTEEMTRLVADYSVQAC